MNSSRRHVPPAAFILITLGLVFLIGQLSGRTPGAMAVVWWPVVLIAIGVAQLLKRPLGPAWSGVLLLILGAGFLLKNLGILETRQLAIAIPLLLIVGGAAVLLQGRR